jgi:Zinc-finger of C2H2 type
MPLSHTSTASSTTLLHDLPTAAQAGYAYRILRLTTENSFTTTAYRVAGYHPEDHIRAVKTFRTRLTRQGSRLQRLESASARKPERQLWKCTLCTMTLTSAKAKTDHIDGRRHKARASCKKIHPCQAYNQEFIFELDVERHQKGRRHLRVVSLQNRQIMWFPKTCL